MWIVDVETAESSGDEVATTTEDGDSAEISSICHSSFEFSKTFCYFLCVEKLKWGEKKYFRLHSIFFSFRS